MLKFKDLLEQVEKTNPNINYQYIDNLIENDDIMGMIRYLYYNRSIEIYRRDIVSYIIKKDHDFYIVYSHCRYYDQSDEQLICIINRNPYRFIHVYPVLFCNARETSNVQFTYNLLVATKKLLPMLLKNNTTNDINISYLMRTISLYDDVQMFEYLLKKTPHKVFDDYFYSKILTNNKRPYKISQYILKNHLHEINFVELLIIFSEKISNTKHNNDVFSRLVRFAWDKIKNDDEFILQFFKDHYYQLKKNKNQVIDDIVRQMGEIVLDLVLKNASDYTKSNSSKIFLLIFEYLFQNEQNKIQDFLRSLQQRGAEKQDTDYIYRYYQINY